MGQAARRPNPDTHRFSMSIYALLWCSSCYIKCTWGWCTRLNVPRSQRMVSVFPRANCEWSGGLRRPKSYTRRLRIFMSLCLQVSLCCPPSWLVCYVALFWKRVNSSLYSLTFMLQISLFIWKAYTTLLCELTTMAGLICCPPWQAYCMLVDCLILAGRYVAIFGKPLCCQFGGPIKLPILAGLLRG